MGYILVDENDMQLLHQKIDKLAEKAGKINSEVNNTMNVEEAAEFLHITKNTLYIKIREKKVPHYKIGKHYFFLKSELLNWAEVPVERD